MTDAIEKPVETPKTKAAKPRAKKKPPTQTAGVGGIAAHGGMGEMVMPADYINWNKLVSLPSFEMFVFEESGQHAGASADEWVVQRRAGMGDKPLYELYAKWHRAKGYWPDETPMGELIQEVK